MQYSQIDGIIQKEVKNSWTEEFYSDTDDQEYVSLKKHPASISVKDRANDLRLQRR